MTISGDYASPISVNGYSCKNCTDVENAKKHIDPAHPKDGPYGVNAAESRERSPAVIFGGALAALDQDTGPRAQTAPAAVGGRLDIRL
jgi:hypothetical protein